MIIDKDYRIVKEFLFISKIWSTSILLNNGSNYVGHFLHSTYHTTKIKSPGQIVFGRDMILPITHVADWRYIRHRKQTQIDNDVILKNANRIDHDYIVGDKVLTGTKSEYKQETPYRGQYEIVQTWNNGTVTPRTGVVTMIFNICNIKPYNAPNVQGRDPA